MTRPSNVRLRGIDTARGVAATAVVLYHCARHLARAHPAELLVALTRFGHAGVDLFFVLSGFIIFFIHRKDIGRPSRLAHYAARRFSRVMPTYWVALLLTVLAASRHGLPSLKIIVLAITLCPTNAPPLLGVAWTLQYEIVFYVVFGVLILHRRLGAGLIAMWFAWIIVAWVGGLSVPMVPRSVYGVCNLEFLFGMVAAAFLSGRTLRRPAVIGWSAALVLISAAAAEDLGVMNGYADLARLTYGLPAAFLITAIAEADRTGRVHVSAWLQTLGAASYSIYLFQFLMIGVVWQIWTATALDLRSPGILTYGVLASTALLGGVLASRLVEQPLLLVFRHRRIEPPRQSPA